VTGSKIPELEVEKLIIKDDGRGFMFYENTRLSSDWTGLSVSGGTAATSRTFLSAASSSGWLKVHILSGSTYGPTGASYYVPLFSTRATYNSA